MIKRHVLRFSQGHIWVARWQSLLCQGGMGNQWNWPVQASVPIGWLRSLSGKIWLSRVNRKLRKVLRDASHWVEEKRVNMARRPPFLISYADTREAAENKKRCKKLEDQRWRSDDVISFIPPNPALPPPPTTAPSCCCCSTVGRTIDLIVARDTSCTLKDCCTKRWHW